LIVALAGSAARRLSPSVAMAQDWHRALYRGIPLSVAYYAGEVRDTNQRFPELIGYEVAVGSQPGVRSALVPAELARFEAAAQTAVANLDDAIAVGASMDQTQLTAVLLLCAIAHGEWARIHPFVNGNGRTARVWANWIAIRFGLPAFVRLKPRPAQLLYAGAAASSMRGDHGPMVVVMHAMLREHLGTRPGP
jgi:Fic family protein